MDVVAWEQKYNENASSEHKLVPVVGFSDQVELSTLLKITLTHNFPH